MLGQARNVQIWGRGATGGTWEGIMYPKIAENSYYLLYFDRFFCSLMLKHKNIQSNLTLGHAQIILQSKNGLIFGQGGTEDLTNCSCAPSFMVFCSNVIDNY